MFTRPGSATACGAPDRTVGLGQAAPLRVPIAPDLAVFHVNDSAAQHAVAGVHGTSVWMSRISSECHRESRVALARIVFETRRHPAGYRTAAPAAVRADADILQPVAGDQRDGRGARPDDAALTPRAATRPRPWPPPVRRRCRPGARCSAWRPGFRRRCTLIMAPPGFAHRHHRLLPVARHADGDAVGDGLAAPSAAALRRSRKHAVTGAAPAACTPRIRGVRSISPSVSHFAERLSRRPRWCSRRPPRRPPNPGACQPSCSPISRPAVFLPSTRYGLMPRVAVVPAPSLARPLAQLERSARSCRARGARWRRRSATGSTFGSGARSGTKITLRSPMRRRHPGAGRCGVPRAGAGDDAQRAFRAPSPRRPSWRGPSASRWRCVRHPSGSSLPMPECRASAGAG